MHGMIDIETLGVTPDSTILSIGALGFNPFSTEIYSEQYVYNRIILESQADRLIDESTLAWWSEQSPEARAEAFGEDNRIELSDTLDELSRFVRKCDKIWANGINFDIPVLEHAYIQLNKAYPWRYHNVLDTRTIYKIDPNFKKLKNNHHALADCLNQIEALQSALSGFGITKIH